MNLLASFDDVVLTSSPEVCTATVSIFILTESDLPRQEGPVKEGSLLGIDVITTTVLAASRVFSGGSREAPPPPYFGKKNNNNEKTQKEEKPAGHAIFANRFCFNISKKTGPPP